MTQKIFDYNVYTDSISNLKEEIISIIGMGETADILSLNTLKLNLGSKDYKMKNLFQQFRYIIPDGQSIVFSLKILNGIKTKAISGAELMLSLINLANQKHYSLYFLGSPENLLNMVKNKIENDYTGIVKAGYQHGYYPIEQEDQVVNNIQKFAPDFLFIAFGSPRKEKFIKKYIQRMNSRIIMGVGGSYEVFVGKKKIGSISKKLGLRWLFRTFQDPIRLLPRYVKCNSYFLYLLLKEILIKMKNSLAL
jgi:N-acetylglucosaminyldiphosphoundecaprenol N-acetyl-beta-D-mannosaminyltransferase